jgi:hypothetical protein
MGTGVAGVATRRKAVELPQRESNEQPASLRRTADNPEGT